MIGIALLGLLVLAIGISTMPAYASFEKHQPVLYTIDFPSSISVGQTISIPYTFSWYNSDGTPVYTESYPGEKEHFRNRIIVHISDEFTLLNEDKFHMGGQGDMYGSHFKNMYKLYVNYSENGTSGSIDLRLDKPLSYDRDIVSFGIEGSDHFDFQTQRTDDGLIFVEPESLIEQYDLDQLAFTTWHIQWIHKDYDANDINERYDWYYHSEEVHKPQTRTDLQVAPSQLEVDFYIPRSGWNDFADYLRFAIPLENIYNTRAWLLEQDASEEFVNDFLIEYPEFTKTRTSQDYSNRSSPPLTFFIYGNYVISTGYSSTPMDNARVCAYDKNLLTNSHQILFNGRTPVCDLTDSSGYFTMYGINDDPDDNTLVDLQVGVFLENDDVSVVSAPDTVVYNFDETVRINHSATVLNYGYISAPSSFYNLYKDFSAIVDAHKFFNSNFRYDIPFVTIEEYAIDSAGNIALYCEGHHCGNVQNRIKNTFVGSPIVVLHEYGHHIQHKLYQSLNSQIPPCSEHNITSVHSAECSWAEGFAWFVPAIVLNSPILSPSSSSYSMNLEDGTLVIDGKLTPFPSTPTYSEGSVASALWDIYDTRNESGDNMSGKLPDFWDAFNDSPAQTIIEWETEWNDNNDPSLDSIFNLNKIRSSITTPPTTPVVPDITFTSSLNSDRSRITLVFEQKIDANFNTSDFTLSQGTISSVRNFDNSAVRYLQVSGIPYDTGVTVTYVGSVSNLGSGVSGNLVSGTSFVTNSVSRPTPVDTPPRISSISDMSLDYTQTRTINVRASDSQNDSITLSLVNAPSFASIVDNGNGRGVITLSPSPSDVGSHNLIVKAVANSKKDTERFRVTVTAPTDTINPTITAPEDKTFEATSALTTLSDSQIGTPTATDNIDTLLTITNNKPSSFPLGNTIITWTATDDSGNSSKSIQTITILDTTDPGFTLNISDMSRMFASGVDFIVNYDTPSATDLVDSDVDVLCDPVSGFIFSFGENIITCTATDDSGNFSTTSFVVSVTVIIPAPSNLQTTSTHNSVTLDWDDSLDESITGYKILSRTSDQMELSTLISDTASSDSMYVVEDLSPDTAYVFSVVALSGFGESSASDLVHIITMQQLPMITAPPDISLEATGILTDVDIGSAIIPDNSELSVSNDAPTSFSLGTTVVTWTATNNSGNTADATQNITVMDTTDPVFTLDVSDMSRMFASNADFVVNYDIPSAMDLVDSDVDVRCDPVSGSIFSFGENIITCTATDDSGNFSTTSFVVSVSIGVPAAPSNIRVTTTHNSVTLDWDEPSDESITGYKILSRTSDQMELSVLIPDIGSPNSMYVVGALSPDTAYVFSVVALNEFGESPSSVFVYIITMQQPPMITAPPDISIEATGILTDVDIGSAIIPDNSELSVSNDAPTSFSLGTTIVTWTATNDSGNFVDATQNITVMDTTDPAFTLDISDMSRMFASGVDFVVNYDVPSATDLVDSDVDVLCDPVSGSIFSFGENIITCTATDDSGNFSTTSFVVSVRVIIPAPSNIQATSTHNSVTLDWDDSPDESITGYKILFGIPFISQQLHTFISDTGSSDSMYVVDGLSSDTDYIFSVVALNEFGESTASDLVYGATLQLTPMITAPPDISLEATGILTDVDIGSAIIPDNSGLSVSNDAPTSFSLGTTIVTWTATNNSGNSVDATQNITVMDTTDPAFDFFPQSWESVVPSDQIITVIFPTPTVRDIADNNPDVICTPASGTMFAVGSTTVTCTATDDSGNSSTTSFVVSVSVRIPVPQSPPSAPSTLQATSTHNSITLDWDEPPDESITGYKILSRTSDQMELSTLISDTASSDSMYVVDGLSPDTIYVFRVVALSEFDESSVSNFVRIATLQQAFIIPNLQAIPTHNSVTLDWDEPPDESITGYKIRSIISFIPQQLSTIVFDTGSPDSMYVVENLESERTYAFRVIALNELGEPTGFSDVRITTLQDPRTFTRITTPPDISIEATGILTDVDIGSASLPANSNYSLSNDAPISFPLGTTIVTWDAIDDIGSASVATQSITVRDTTGPTFDSFTQSWGFLFTSEQTRTVIFLTTASDIVDDNPDVICTPASGTVFAVGSTIVTCTATDDSDNSTVITFDVFVSQSTSMPS